VLIQNPDLHFKQNNPDSQRIQNRAALLCFVYIKTEIQKQ